MRNKRVGVISLGCDKNRVDTEKMLAILEASGYSFTNEIASAKIVIINTCAFLESARKEAIEEILSVAESKKQGDVEKIIVTGCLPQKFIDDIYSALPEVDGFLGVSDYDKIVEVIERVYRKGERVNAVGIAGKECGTSRRITTNHYAYLKIADGCSNHCTYCLIPKIRGAFRSIPTEQLIVEAKNLGEVKELILVAQDTAKYGYDLNNGENLVGLIRALSSLENIKSIRLLYCYPENITDQLIEEIATNDKVIKYLDIPLQHADDKILKLMNRKGSYEGYLQLVNKLREKIEGIAIRSTFITGFPTESEEAFNNLLCFIENVKLDNAGFFKYSREEGTAAYNLDGQIPEGVKNKRLKKLYSVQKKVVKKKNANLVGKTIEVLAEGFDEDAFTYYGRAYFSAPEIDGKVYFFSGEEVIYGEKVQVKITESIDYDLYGERL